MKPELKIDTVGSETDRHQILKLLTENHVSTFSSYNIQVDGFLTAKHDLEMLTKMNLSANQVIAKVDYEVIGYELTMLPQSQILMPTLIPMFEKFKKLTYMGENLEHINYYVMGQVCVAKNFRGKGVFNRLYQKHKEIYSPQFDCRITEVAVRNIHSRKSHEHIGFKIIHTYFDETDEWNILIWEWY